MVQYVDSDSVLVREDLLGFIECDTGLSGQCLADKITTFLTSLGIDLSNLRGQAYDGAGNMAGSVRGTAARISAKYPLAMYLHCTSHCLNLSVVKALQVTIVRNMMGVLGNMYQFFASHPKRQRALDDIISMHQPTSSVHKLKDMCRTRWVQRINALEVFISLHESVVLCLEMICTQGPREWSSVSLTEAGGLKLALSTTDLLSALVICNSCLRYVQALTTNLQAEAKSILEAVKEIDTVIYTLENVRVNIETHHSTWFSTITSMFILPCQDSS